MSFTKRSRIATATVPLALIFLLSGGMSLAVDSVASQSAPIQQVILRPGTQGDISDLPQWISVVDRNGSRVGYVEVEVLLQGPEDPSDSKQVTRLIRVIGPHGEEVGTMVSDTGFVERGIN